MHIEAPFRVNVVGAGICGLSVAQALVRAFGRQVEVTVTAEKFYDQTTSYAAGGLWEPHLLGDTPPELVRRWSEESYSHYRKMYFSKDAGVAGIQQIKVHNLFSDEDNDGQMTPDPIWSDIPGLEFYCPSPEQLVEMGYPQKYTHAHCFTSYVADPKFYLLFLMKYLQKSGVRFEKGKVEVIEDQLNKKTFSDNIAFDVVVNCTGLGAFSTENDTSMYPIRGQVLRVRAPWIKSSCTFGQSYVIPNMESLVIGGTGQKGDWNVGESTEDSRSIIDGVCEMFPSLRDAKILGTYVGLRPCRPSVRLDSEEINVHRHHSSKDHSQLLVRCYGLGGSGFTIGPGLAKDVVEKHIRPFMSTYALSTIKVLSKL